jgi:hypothetical protein
VQAEGQNIRAHSLLQRKREKVSRKYTQPSRRRQLSPGFLEDALDEVGLFFLCFLPIKKVIAQLAIAAYTVLVSSTPVPQYKPF